MTAPHSVLLSLVDLLAALFFAGGLFFIARMLAQKSKLVGELAYLSFFLIASSGALIALINLSAAVKDIPRLRTYGGAAALLTQGFICLAWALWRGLRGRTADLTAGRIWLAPLFISALVLGTATVFLLLRWERAWLWLLTGAAMVGSLLTFLQLVRRAQERGLPLLALLFALSFAVALAQTGLLPSAEQVPPWIGPFFRVSAQSAFALSAWQLSKAESWAQNQQK